MLSPGFALTANTRRVNSFLVTHEACVVCRLQGLSVLWLVVVAFLISDSEGLPQTFASEFLMMISFLTTYISFLFFCFLKLFFQGGVSLCRPDCTETLFVVQTGLELTEIPLSLSLSLRCWD